MIDSSNRRRVITRIYLWIWSFMSQCPTSYMLKLHERPPVWHEQGENKPIIRINLSYVSAKKTTEHRFLSVAAWRLFQLSFLFSPSSLFRLPVDLIAKGTAGNGPTPVQITPRLAWRCCNFSWRIAGFECHKNSMRWSDSCHKYPALVATKPAISLREEKAVWVATKTTGNVPKSP